MKEGMQATRFAILSILKRLPQGATVEALTKELGLASMTVRQHLTILERDGYVTYQQVRRSLGRPHHVYTITSAADEVFPKNYALLTERILSEVRNLQPVEIEGLSADAKVALIFERMADKLAAQKAPLLDGRPLHERIEVVTAMLNDEGAISEWEGYGERFEIRSFNCPYQKVAEGNPQLCDWHRQTIERLIGQPISLEHCLMNGERMDTYVVHVAPEADMIAYEAFSHPLADVEMS
jgi:predicted ArsR family transcriptional regulator